MPYKRAPACGLGPGAQPLVAIAGVAVRELHVVTVPYDPVTGSFDDPALARALATRQLGQPDASAGLVEEDCAVILTESARWNDVWCSSSSDIKGFLCETGLNPGVEVP